MVVAPWLLGELWGRIRIRIRIVRALIPFASSPAFGAQLGLALFLSLVFLLAFSGTTLARGLSPPRRGCTCFRAIQEHFEPIRTKFLDDSSKLAMPAADASVHRLEKNAMQRLVVVSKTFNAARTTAVHTNHRRRRPTHQRICARFGSFVSARRMIGSPAHRPN